MAGLNKALENVNCEILEMMKCSQEQESDFDRLQKDWLQERDLLSSSITQLRSSLEHEMKVKEETLAEVCSVKGS